MGDKTKIDWADASWNPVTGCLHGCEYCYARRIAERFRAKEFSGAYTVNEEENVPRTTYELEEPAKRCCTDAKGLHVYEKAPYPFGFVPTFHRYRLDDPKHWTKPKNIFVCSMADLFGEWVPDEWILEVMEACVKAPQHRYMFLTKNPSRYVDLFSRGKLPTSDNMWYGTSTPTSHHEFFFAGFVNTFVSIEPILEPFTDLCDNGIQPVKKCNWIIVGAETGSRRNKVVPEKSWISELMDASKMTNTPLFMKDSLRDIMGDDFIQQFPWEV